MSADFLDTVARLVDGGDRGRGLAVLEALVELALELDPDERALAARLVTWPPWVGSWLQARLAGSLAAFPPLDEDGRRSLRAAWDAVEPGRRAATLASALALVASRLDEPASGRTPAPVGGKTQYYVDVDAPMPSMAAPPRPRTATPPGIAPYRPAPTASGWRVNIGLAPRRAPDEPLEDTSLRRRRRYWLWVELARGLLPGALSHGAPDLPRVPSGGEITVVVSPFPGHLRVVGPRSGRIRLANGAAEVTAQAAVPAHASDLLAHRLFFEVRTPWRHGRYLVRVSFHFRNLLLQSHVITAWVGPPPVDEPPLDGTLDYALSHSLDLATLQAVPDHRLSILLNDDGAGTHGLRFFGSESWIRDAHLDDVQLNGLIDYARGGLREVAWANREPFRPGACRYRYEPPDPALLEPDLILLARHGYRLYSETTKALGIPGRKARTLADLMRAPGHVQVALKRGAAHLYPASLVYDHPLDSSSRNVRVCAAFRAAIAARRGLADEPCFRGACPSYGDMNVVCPAGFWGYRHRIGVPISLDEGDAPAAITAGGRIELLVALSTDPELARRERHVAAIQAMPATTVIAEDRATALDALRGRLHVAYFYCHGGLTAAGVPYLEVGPRGSEPIVGDNLLAYGIEWDDPRPLVILNGCHTTAAKPEQLMDLVGGFVNHARAAGVFGTEITVFEPLAVAFGEELLRNLLAGVAAGEAVRRARLSLLADGNPLGLAYIPFVMPSLAIA